MDPTVSDAQPMGSGSGGGAEDDDDGASEAEDGTIPDATPPCNQVGDEQGWIRVVDGAFQLDFGEYDWGDEVFGCDSEPPCVGKDGEHLRLVVPRSGDTFAPLGEFSVEAGTLSGSERWCGCCNGEGDEPPEWDETRVLESDRLEIDGADASCVSGHWLERGGYESERTFVAIWCR